MSNYKTTKINFDNVTDEQIAYGIQCCEREVTRFALITRALTDGEKHKLEEAEITIKQSRAELQKRANSVKTKRMF
jgi:hypothetical protein